VVFHGFSFEQTWFSVFLPLMLVLAAFKRKEFVQKINDREVPKDNAAR